VRWPNLLRRGEFFSRQTFHDVNVKVQKSYRAIHTPAMEGLWRNVEVGKAFQTAYRSTSDVRS
jgi:hypothetical protein